MPANMTKVKPHPRSLSFREGGPPSE